MTLADTFSIRFLTYSMATVSQAISSNSFCSYPMPIGAAYSPLPIWFSSVSRTSIAAVDSPWKQLYVSVSSMKKPSSRALLVSSVPSIELRTECIMACFCSSCSGTNSRIDSGSLGTKFLSFLRHLNV